MSGFAAVNEAFRLARKLNNTLREALKVPQKAANQQTADEAFAALVKATRNWVDHMDQWEKFKFDWPHGTIYVTISMAAEYPDSFDSVKCEAPSAADSPAAKPTSI